VIDFTGQVVIVTGAGRGLGRLYALDLAARGASVVVNDVDADVAEQAVAEIEKAGGVAVASLDSVATPECGQAIVDTAVERFDRLDAVVSNAGIFDTVPFDELSPERWSRMLNVHLDGGFYLCQPAFRVMKAQGYGRFVFIVSSAGLFGQPNSAHYAAAKAGLLGLTNAIAIEGAEHGVLANTVLPFGFTRMVTDTVGDGDGDGDGDGEELREASAFLCAIEPELVVPIVVFLASGACGVTHHNYSACAGRFARVFVGLAEGWAADPGTAPTADDIAVHFAEVSATEPYTVPTSIFDEVAAVCARYGISV
jgi:NAD(P)-dependent dehydrogenase (short-subunit alcohol dehydrogenase family)